MLLIFFLSMLAHMHQINLSNSSLFDHILLRYFKCQRQLGKNDQKWRFLSRDRWEGELGFPLKRPSFKLFIRIKEKRIVVCFPLDQQPRLESIKNKYFQDQNSSSGCFLLKFDEFLMMGVSASPRLGMSEFATSLVSVSLPMSTLIRDCLEACRAFCASSQLQGTFPKFRADFIGVGRDFS